MSLVTSAAAKCHDNLRISRLRLNTDYFKDSRRYIVD